MISVNKKIAGVIAQSGAISLADYMSEAVKQYYADRDPFGSEGDFITAPEVSQMFGEMIGIWCAQMWQKHRQRDSILAELGPGRGTLMKDILRAGAVVPDFVESQRVYLVEQSTRLKEMQKKALPESRIVDQFSDVPSGFLLLVANEFFDALPIRQFRRTEQGWREVCITLRDGQFAFTLSETDPDIALAPQPVGAIAEICPQGEKLIAEIADHIKQHGGAALIIDYGADQTIFGDTLQAVRGHQFCSVLKAGDADITAHVRFGRLAEIAKAHHLSPRIITQGEFLQRQGICARAAQLAKNADEAAQHEIQTALARLIAPDQMGELFKVMSLQ